MMREFIKRKILVKLFFLAAKEALYIIRMIPVTSTAIESNCFKLVIYIF